MIVATLFFVLVVSSNEWVVNLQKGVDPNVFAQQHGLVYVKQFLTDLHVFTSANPRARVEQTLRGDTEQVVWAEYQVVRPKQLTRGIPDPLYESQWHLHTHPFGVDADHSNGKTGAGITIAIVDDGLQHAHPDIAANYDALHSWDFNDDDSDPKPEGVRDGHGTAAAGVAASVKENGHCGRGVAPKAKLVGLRTIAAGVTDLTEATALSYNGIGAVDIYSCSWGPVDDGVSMQGPGPIVQHTLALYAGQKRGRFGKGNIYVWAAGNGRENGDSCAFDGYASSIYVNPIGSINHLGEQSWYSEGCASLMAVTPSSGAMKGITTVDLMGGAGYDPTECTSNFGGTSSSAPLAAGIIALILEQRPDLTWRDVKHVIAKGSVPVQVEDPDWHMNRAGYRHSHRYGFGLMKVPSLLQAAIQHRLVPANFSRYDSPLVTLTTSATMIPCNYTYRVSGVTNIHFIEHVAVFVGISHERRGNLKMSLVSPEGTVSVLAPLRQRDNTFNYPSSGWTFTSVRHWGESTVNGNWTFIFEDNTPQTRGRGHFNAFRLSIFGY